MKFEIKIKTDDDYSSELTITVASDRNATYHTLLPEKARLVAEALLQAAAAAETTGKAQALIDAILCDKGPTLQNRNLIAGDVAE